MPRKPHPTKHPPARVLAPRVRIRRAAFLEHCEAKAEECVVWAWNDHFKHMPEGHRLCEVDELAAKDAITNRVVRLLHELFDFGPADD